MKKTLVALSIMAASSMALAQDTSSDTSSGPIGYPGSTWGVLTLNPGVRGAEEKHNVLLQGKVEQGIDWFAFGTDKNWRFNTYVSMGYTADKNGLAYNNKVVPAIGAKVSRRYESGVLDLGLQAVQETQFRGVPSGGRRTDTGVQLYASYWFGWNLK